MDRWISRARVRTRRVATSIRLWWLRTGVLIRTLPGNAVPVKARTARFRGESGQTVAEYALVLLVAAAVATAFLLWARQSGRLDAFFDAIFERLLGSVQSEPTPTP
jgi:Flp pilus assembly pilin Flp